MTKYEKLITFIDNLINVANQLNKNPLQKDKESKGLMQKNDDICDYPVINRYFQMKARIDSSKDRVVPISTELINDYNQKTGSKIGRVEMCYGPNADELIRDSHATALTLGMAIYMSSRAYKPETEEGQKTIFHELTHVKQNKEDSLQGQKTVEELEKEAEAAEKLAETIKNEYRTIEVGGREYKVSKETYKKLMQTLKERIEKWLEDQELVLSDEKFLELLLKYESIESAGRLPWQKI